MWSRSFNWKTESVTAHKEQAKARPDPFRLGLMFLCLVAQTPDSDGHYPEWLGTRSGGKPKTLYGKGARILGLVERRTGSVKALGLIFEQR